MVDFICTSPSVAKTLQNSVQWQLLLKHLERNGIGANVWVDGDDQPISVQIPNLPDKISNLPNLKASKSANAAGAASASGIN
ncbi:hypothetical protein C7271_17005 [filamentous cyanobacterium CCP5]|nr:hypothetical protein C7271_17005 [filamentous cyanobacterium CCP5]